MSNADEYKQKAINLIKMNATKSDLQEERK